MTRDYAKNRRKTNRRSGYQSRVPAWVWLFSGSVLGAFIMFLIYLAGIPPQPSKFPELSIQMPVEPADETVSEESSNEVEKQREIPKPRFDFYQLLKDSEVAKLEPPDAPITPVTSDELYTLQAGSFRDPNNADRLRAELLLLNLETRIETVKARNAETLHLVIVGPFNSKNQVAKARGLLASKDIDSLVLKQNPEQGDG